MPLIHDVAQFLDCFAPVELAAEWDNVGLLMGDRQANVERVMTCLTITPQSAAEAIRERADLIVAHHPLPFRPLRRITSDATAGKLLWELARQGIAIYSPHTAFDSAREGINAQLAAGLDLVEVQPLVPIGDGASGDELGSGRHGRLAAPCTLAELATRVKKLLTLEHLQVSGSSQRTIATVAIACGSAGELLGDAIRADCDCLLTGELRFHDCLEAEAAGMALLLAGHYASERCGVEQLAPLLAAEFSALTVWASRDEQDPLRWC